MVALDDSQAAQLEKSEPCPIVGKKEKAHTRSILGVWSFPCGIDGQIALITVAHDSLKLWRVDEVDEKIVTFSEKKDVVRWRAGVQSADITDDGKSCIAVLGLDSILYEVVLSDDGFHVLERDFGYMEAMHIKIAKTKMNYVTASLSGHLSEINLNGEFSRREPMANVRQVSSLAYSNNNKLIAVGNNEGAVMLYCNESFKLLNTLEVHAMKIRTIVFSPDDSHIFTGSDDKTVKLYSIVGERAAQVRMFCGSKAPITNVILDMSCEAKRFACANQLGQVFIWSVDEHAYHILPSVHTGLVYGVSFSPSGKHLFSAGDDRQLVCYRIPASDVASNFNGDEHDGADDSIDMDYKPAVGNFVPFGGDANA